MLNFTISEEDKKSFLRLQKHPHPYVRKKALALQFKAEKLSTSHICKLLDICPNTLCSYIKGYQDKGMAFVTAINFYKPQSKLNSFEEVLKTYFEQTPPSSIAQACSEIGERTGVYLKNTQMRCFIKTLGISYKKVCGIPARANIAEQHRFKEERLDPRLAEARAGKRALYFMDAAHFVLGAFLGYLWSLTRVFVRTPAGRKRFNVLGALNAITKTCLTITNDTYITSVQVCELLEIIKKTATLPITIVLDNARYQRCTLVMDCAQRLGIELLFLPPYSPNLNLIERLWKFTKKKCLNSVYYSDFTLFKQTISTFLEGMSHKHKSELDSLLTLNFQMFQEDQLKQAI